MQDHRLSEDQLPDEAALLHSEKLQSLIKTEIRQNGPMPFDRYMELALYAPGLGYYTAGSQKFGASGDFVTAPEISSLFSRCLANQCQQVLEQTGGSILEFGAGSGIMAAHILKQLADSNTLPDQYFILDLSPDLRQRQLKTLKHIVPDLLDRVVWIDQLPEKFTGIVLANEVLDAMPASVFKKTETEVLEQFVVVGSEGLESAWMSPSKGLLSAVKKLEVELGAFQSGYVSEINLRLDGWFKAVSESLQQGVVILIDYGYTKSEYYTPERNMGTLICHYRHRAHDNPFKLVGLQDITVNVDFSAVSDAAQKAGFERPGYTPQANFLIATGIENFLGEFSADDTEKFLQISQGVKVLMLPSEMGERFKVMGFLKNLQLELSGFAMRDLSDRL